MENQVIKLTQEPVIQHQLLIVGQKVSERIAELNVANLIATEDTVSALKKMRAELNKESAEFETQRKAVKNTVLKPYNDFESIYDAEIKEKYKNADDLLKSKITGFEMKIKTDKKNALVSYFNEICEFNSIDFLRFENIISEVNLSTSEKKYKEQIFEFVNQAAEDLALIETETYAAEILVEYKNTLKLSSAIATIRNRKEQEKVEREKFLLDRTQKRVTALQALAFVFDDLTKTYRFVSSNEVFIKLSDVEMLEDDEWTKKYVELENTVKELQKQTISAPKTETQPQAEAQPQAVKKETYTATFEVSGTFAELAKLQNFLKENNFKYKNI